MTTPESVRAQRSGEARGWQAETLRDPAVLISLAAEWDDLYERCPSATAFLSSAWLLSWWRSYGERGRLAVVTVRHGGTLVAAAPLIRRRRYGVPVLTTIGAGISDFTDILVADGYAEEGGRRLAEELAGRHRWHTIDLPEVPEDAAAWHLVAAWPAPVRRVRGSVCLELPARPVDELIRTLPRPTAKTRRAKQRKITALGIETRIVPADQAAQGAETLVRLHRRQWRGRGMNPEHGRPRFAAHLAGALPAMVAQGRAVLVEHRWNSAPAAVELLIGGHRAIGAYLYGFRPELRERIDVAQLLFAADLDIARSRGRSTLSLLRGDEPYKRQWRPREAPNQRVLLPARGFPPAVLYIAAVLGRRRLATIVKSHLRRFRPHSRR